IGYSEMLLEDAEADGSEEQTADLKRIHIAGKHLLTLVSDVLDLSKLEAGKMEAYPERFELGQVIDEAVAKAKDAIAANGNRLIVDCTDRGTVMETDLSKLRQAMANLLDNAGKFTRNGTVTLIGRVREGMAEITIRDTGVGISRENLPNLFQNFGEAEG